MKPLPYVNLKPRDGTWLHKDSILNLMFLIEKEVDPWGFKEQLLSIIQLYFDGLIEKGLEGAKREDIWLEQEEILTKLNTAGKEVVGSFYRRKDIAFDKIKEIVLSNGSKIIKYAHDIKGAKYRHLAQVGGQSNVQRFGLKLTDMVSKGEPLDTIVCVASGGFEPSFLAMDILEKEFLVPARYSWVNGNRQDTEVRVPRYAPKNYLSSKVKGKKVLVVEDIVSSGKSLAKVLKKVNKNGPDDLLVGVVRSYDYFIPFRVRSKLKEKDKIFVAEQPPKTIRGF